MNFYVDYDFPTINLLREPLMIIIALFIFCLSIMFYVRFDFSISKSKASILQEKNTLIIEIIENYIERQIIRNNIYLNIESSNDQNDLKKYQKEREEIETYVRDQIINFLELNKADDVKNKVNEIEKAEKIKFNLLKEILSLKDQKEKLKIERERKKLFDRQLNKNHANGMENDDDRDDDDAKGSSKAWIDKMGGASSSKSGFKPYTGGEGGSNIRGPRRFGGAPTNCGPSS